MWTHLFNGQFEFLDFDRYLKRYEIYYKENSADNKIWFELFQDRIDRNPDATPYDDLRHYAYEGDGNSGGSLSSLNSGTSDADLVRTCFLSNSFHFERFTDSVKWEWLTLDWPS